MELRSRPTRSAWFAILTRLAERARRLGEHVGRSAQVRYRTAPRPVDGKHNGGVCGVSRWPVLARLAHLAVLRRARAPGRTGRRG